jgi:HEAT repeat protein
MVMNLRVRWGQVLNLALCFSPRHLFVLVDATKQKRTNNETIKEFVLKTSFCINTSPE